MLLPGPAATGHPPRPRLDVRTARGRQRTQQREAGRRGALHSEWAAVRRCTCRVR